MYYKINVIGLLSAQVGANCYVTDEQKAKAEKKCQEEERKKQQEPKVYSKEEVTELLISLRKGALTTEDLM